MQKTERIEWIDISKFSAIILVAWLHFGAPSHIDDLVHIFHMPVFFFISGFCFDECNHKSFLTFLKSRFKKLIIPYFLFGIFFYAIWNIFYIVVLPDRFTSFQKFIVTLFVSNTEPILYMWGAVQWFLTSLFFAQIIFWFICKAVSNEYLRCLLSVIISLAYIYLFNNFGLMRLPLAIDTSIVSLCFYGAGHIFSVKKLIDDKNSDGYWVLVPVLFVILIVLYFFFGTSNVRTINIPYPLTFILGGITGSLLIVMVSVLITRILKRNYSESKLFRDLLYIGQNTIVILYLHRFFDGIDKTLLDLAGISFENVVVRYLYFGFMTLLFFVICKYPIRVIDKCIPFMLGKKNK